MEKWRWKKLWYTSLLAILLIIVLPSSGQNLISNGSFEDTLSCPELPGQISYSKGWFTISGTPDLFHTCSSNPHTSIPNPSQGLPAAKDGKAASGLVFFL